MPELGKYSLYVLGAYGGTFLVLAGLVLLSLHRHRRVRRTLRALEDRRRARDG